jgi:serine/threonine protein kinase
MTQAFINQLQHVMILRKIYLGSDHAAFKMDKYQVDYRVYLQRHRNPRELRQILRFVGEGINELHSIGYIHRDLKPENIVLNLKPLSVKLIDFNRSNNTKMISSGLQ